MEEKEGTNNRNISKDPNKIEITSPGSNIILPQSKSSLLEVEAAAPLFSKEIKSGSIIVSLRQKGNPILKLIKNVPWMFGDIVPDYQLSLTTCALYLSLRYHNLNSEYIHDRLKQLASAYILRILLVLVDVSDPHHSLKELSKICILADCTLIVAFNPEDAAKYLEIYKSFENKPPDLIMEKTDTNYMAKLIETLTSVKKINKTDTLSLSTTFDSFEKLVEASENDLALCPGMGPTKANKLYKTLHQPFLKDPNTKQK